MKNDQTTHPQKRILLIAPFSAPFIDVEIEILQTYGEVRIQIQNGVKAIPSILWNALFCDVLYCWFGSVYSAIASLYAKIINKPCIIIIGGADAAAVPEINYGIWLTPWKAALLTQGLRNATQVLVVAPSLKDRLVEFASYDGKNITYLPTGYDTSFWTISEKKEKMVLTVGNIDSEIRLLTKGIDYFLRAAEKMPDTEFVAIGIHRDLLTKIGMKIPENVSVLPPLTREMLRSYYQNSAVYCQPSRSEGLPNTVCEAMACGCIPVGMDVGGISTAIGDTGLITPPGDIEALMHALQTALEKDTSMGHRARERIVQEFPLEKRVAGLKRIIEDITCD